jgi:tetratricopeptide (TPR) repeat protein
MKKHGKDPIKPIKLLLIAAVAAALTATAATAATVRGTITKTNGEKLTGKIQWQPASKVYLLQQNGVSLRISPSEVAGIDVPKPNGYDRAVRQVQGGNFSSAIPTLERIKNSYERLKWDVKAARHLAYAYLEDGDASRALRMCEDVIRGNPEAALDPDFASVYWDALLEKERIPALEDKLQKAIREGSRSLAAMAQIKRGHIQRKNGNYREALVDGYLRTIVLFKRVRSAQPEALYYAIQCFKELGQHTYAEKMRKRLLEGFPQNKYAARVRTGI